MNVVQVECYSGYRPDQRPTKFKLGGRVYSVECVEDQWYSPSATYFRVRADDGNLYVLRHDEECDIWTLEAFRRHDTIPGQRSEDHTE
ncbi:MAG: hypothetical protein HXY20_00610 [Acidobacteria bacterium]|nr:hypothetical protein [Acidobacteriota bacterium]